MRLRIALLILSACAVANADNRVGCYQASVTNNVLGTRAMRDSGLTPAKCRDACDAKSKTYYGLLEGDKCYCGNTLYSTNLLHDSFCVWRCSGDRAQHCGSDQGMWIVQISGSEERPVPSFDANAFAIARGKKTPLFAILAGSGKDLIAEYDKSSRSVLGPGSFFPKSFRSALLDNLPAAIREYNAKRIVVEMQKKGRMVAMAAFDVSYGIDSLTSYSWFDASRLVETYPFWTGNSPEGFSDFGIYGHNPGRYQRKFYIQFNHGGCEVDRGLLGISVSTNDGCTWVSKGSHIPNLFYAKTKGLYNDVVDYADKFVIYMQ